MADSENSRTLPAITRRKMLIAPVAFAAASSATLAYATPAASFAVKDAENTDPALRLWGEWRLVHERYLRLSELRWNLESQLCREAQAPEVKIRLPNGRTAYACEIEEIDDYLRDWPEIARIGARAKAQLAALDRKWDAADQRLGCSRTRHAEKQALELRARLATSVLTTPSRSTAGAAAKLSCFIDMNTPVDHWRKHINPALLRYEQPSWPELRSVLNDLVLIGGRDIGLFQA